MSDDRSNVVQFVAKVGRFPLRRGVKPEPRCPHACSLVDYNQRAVWCEDCGATLDPFQTLASIASDVEWVEILRREKANLEREIAAMYTERDALKSSVAGLKKRRGLK